MIFFIHIHPSIYGKHTACLLHAFRHSVGVNDTETHNPDLKTFSHPPLNPSRQPTHAHTLRRQNVKRRQFNLISVWKRKIKDGYKRSWLVSWNSWKAS